MRDWRIDSADSLWELVHALTPRSATGGTTADGFQRRGSHINRTIFETLWGDGICPRVPHVTLLGLVAERGEWSGKVNMATDEALKALARLRKHVARLNEAIEASPWARAVYIADSAGALQLVVDESAVLKRLEDRSRSSPRGAPKLVSVTILTQRTERGLAVLCPGEPIQLEVVSAVDGYLHVFHEDLLGQVDDLFALHHATKYVHRHRRVALPTNVLPKRMN